jgi:hypothetical protein
MTRLPFIAGEEMADAGEARLVVDRAGELVDPDFLKVAGERIQDVGGTFAAEGNFASDVAGRVERVYDRRGAGRVRPRLELDGETADCGFRHVGGVATATSATATSLSPAATVVDGGRSDSGPGQREQRYADRREDGWLKTSTASTTSRTHASSDTKG